MGEHIDEQTRRWDDFQGGRPITLPDGQVWQFYEPSPTLRPGVESPVPSWTFADDPILDVSLAYKFASILVKWASVTRAKERASAAIEAAWFLLARNYHLTLAEFESIMLQAAMWDDSAQAALGRELGGLLDDVLNRSLVHAEAV